MAEIEQKPAFLTNPRFRAALISIIASLVILGLKWVAYVMTSSAALKSDALESVVNVVSSMFALGALMFAEQPADREHPYGHGKIEFFSAAFEGGLISLAAVIILYEAVKAFFQGEVITALNVGLILNISAGALNGLLGLYLIRRGKALKSEALEADGHHVMSDFMTTLGVFAGLVLLKITGIWWFDPAIALIVGLTLARTGYKLVQNSSSALLDKQDEGMLEKIVSSINRNRPADIIAVHELRAIRSGRHTHADVHIVVPEFREVRGAHDLVEEFCANVIRDSGLDGEFHSHIDPCMRSYCESCPVDPCPIRKNPYKDKQNQITVAMAMKPGPNEIGEIR